MELHLSPEVEEKLNNLASLSGRSTSELVQDAVAGMVDELTGTRQMLNTRYEEIEEGKVDLIDGEEAFDRLKKRIDARRIGAA